MQETQLVSLQLAFLCRRDAGDLSDRRDAGEMQEISQIGEMQERCRRSLRSA
jgi:hypothetical protein